MVFDTTASNTGHLAAARVCVQQQLEHALLWSGCRHYIGEVILNQVFQDLVTEALKSTEVSVFSRFRKHFNWLDTSTQLMDISSYEMNAKSMPTVDRLREYSLSVLQSDFIPARDYWLISVLSSWVEKNLLILEHLELCIKLVEWQSFCKVSKFASFNLQLKNYHQVQLQQLYSLQNWGGS